MRSSERSFQLESRLKTSTFTGWVFFTFCMFLLNVQLYFDSKQRLLISLGHTCLISSLSDCSANYATFLHENLILPTHLGTVSTLMKPYSFFLYFQFPIVKARWHMTKTAGNFALFPAFRWTSEHHLLRFFYSQYETFSAILTHFFILIFDLYVKNV